MYAIVKGVVPRRLRSRGRVWRVAGVGAMLLWGIIILLSGHAQKQAHDTAELRRNQAVDSSSRSDQDVRVVPAPEPALDENEMEEDTILNEDIKHARLFNSRQFKPIENQIKDDSARKEEMKKRKKFIHDKFSLNIDKKIIKDNKNENDLKKRKADKNSLDKNDAQEVDLVPVIPVKSNDGIQNHAGENLEDVYEDKVDADDVIDDKVSAEFNKFAKKDENDLKEEKYKEDLQRENKRLKRSNIKEGVKINANENVIKEPLLKNIVKEKDGIEESEYTGINMAAVASDMDARRQRVREVCAKNGLGPHASKGTPQTVKHPPSPQYGVFYFDRGDELAYCPIYKAATTSWLHNFAILGGLTEEYLHTAKQQISEITRRLWPSLEYEDAEKAFNFCLKFMIVRHPFERLVSAYRDKLENINIGREHGVLHFYEKYGKKIVAKYRGEGKPPPANRYSQDMDDPSLPPPEGVEPTFEEFVRYIINTDLVYYSDDHWMPYYLHCTPCLLDYDVIAKFETLDRDQNYIIKKRKLEHKIKSSWKHMTKGKKTSETMKKYFATISKDQLLKLYDKYRLDFELFDYTISDYLHLVME